MAYGTVNVPGATTGTENNPVREIYAKNIIIGEGPGGIMVAKFDTENGFIYIYDALISGNLNIYGYVSPGEDATHRLGSSSRRWKTVYASSGTIQTSDRSAKDDIYYLIDNDQKITAYTLDEQPEKITTEDVLDFVRNLKGATFRYISPEQGPEDIQLGFIADDMCNHKLFPYIGVENTDENGNMTRGVQPVPMLSAGLIVNQYVLNELDELTNENHVLKEQVNELKSQVEELAAAIGA